MTRNNFQYLGQSQMNRSIAGSSKIDVGPVASKSQGFLLDYNICLAFKTLHSDYTLFFQLYISSGLLEVLSRKLPRLV